MRKYQQLLLLLISCFSVGVLLIYKSENNRLKYVLQVVNFFGRSDAAVLRRLDNVTKDETIPEFAKPLPVWQLIGDSFHAYSAYWNRNQLVSGGEAHVIVVGKAGSVVNFRCNFTYDNGARSIQGKFHFQRGANESMISDDKSNEFTIYNFFCRVTRDFGEPESVVFIDHTSSMKTGHKIRLRYLKPTNSTSTTTAANKLLQATVCVDLVNYNSSTKFARNPNNLLQFFLFHLVLGIEHFLIYNSDEIPGNVLQLLRRTNIHLHLMPFNFPFGHMNAPVERLRGIIETDCLLRNIQQSRHTLLLTENEFFYPNAKLNGEASLQQQLQHYSTDLTRFELPIFTVCLDERFKLLVDNHLYDPEKHAPHSIFIYRLNQPVAQLFTAPKSVVLPVSAGIVHRYIDCVKVGQDGLHDWRSPLREDFLQHIGVVRNEVDHSYLILK